jgi:hypothetical protein
MDTKWWQKLILPLGMSSMKITHFVPIVNKHGYHQNLVGIIYGISSIKIAHFVLIG